MIRSIVGSSLRFRSTVLALAAGLLLLGIAQLPGMPVDVFPEFAPPRVEIQTPCLGLSADEAESFVTVPLEQALNGVEGLELMRSKSVPDLSYIELLFKPRIDILQARQLVQERIATVTPTLPNWAAPPFMMPPVSTTGRFMKIGLSSKTVSLTDMSMIAYWTIRARLLRVPGVANVAIWGERIKMPQVQVVPGRMSANDVSLDQVMEVTADALVNGGPGLMLVVEKYPWANTLQVTHGVEEALAELRPGLTGIDMDWTIFRPADFIELALDNLTRALLLGCLLVMLVLVAFLF